MPKSIRFPAVFAWVAAACGLPAHGASPAFDIGARHTCAVDTRGEVACWGDNFFGQLGNGEIVGDRRLPVPGVERATSVAIGGSTTCALTSVGGVKCWGDNSTRVLGDPATTDAFRSTVGDVSGLDTGVTQIEVGGGFACALTGEGAVKCWGRPASIGRPGGPTPVPGDVIGLSSGARAIAAGNSEACAITAEGGVRCWGQFNNRGQLGDGTTRRSDVPVAVVGLSSGVAAISMGYAHACALMAEGHVRCWGDNESGQLGGAGTSPYSTVPVEVPGVSGAISIAAGGQFTCALTTIGAVVCWGFAPGLNDLPPPAVIPTLASGVTSISAGPLVGHLCVTHADGGVSCLGGFAWQISSRRAVRLANLVTPVRAVAIGDEHACAVDGAAQVVCWGANTVGQLGVAHAPSRIAVRVDGLGGPARSIATGHYHSCAVLESGAAKCWGANFMHQLGDGTDIARGSPADVMGLQAGARGVGTGGNYSCVLLASEMRCWGGGLLRRAPEVVPGVGADVVSFAVGDGFGCLVNSAGGVRCWGNNTDGQLGNGSFVSSPAAVDVHGLGSGAVAVAAGDIHACALLATGGVKCWGSNVAGQLGIPVGGNRATPVEVPGFASGARSLAAKLFSTCVVVDGGVPWCWGTQNGQNAHAQPLRNLQSGALAVSRSSQSHTCALFAGGGVNCFGSNVVAQLGDGTRVLARDKPESVVAPDGASFLDLTPEDPIGPEAASLFLAVTRDVGAAVQANIRVRAEDVGRSASFFVFAMAPADQVAPARDGAPAFVVGKAVRAGGEKDLIHCVLAQLSSSGQLVGVTAASLQAYLTSVLSGQGQAVSIVNNVGLASIGGATFFVGYGSSASGMLTSGNNRGVVTIPGTSQCRPEPPQTGWWWNPAEDGRGFSIERRGNNLFFASFLYDISGRSTWYVSSGPVSLDGSLYMGDLLSARGGQTLGGAYPGFPTLSNAGPISLAFNTASTGTMVWPGGAVPIQRFNIVPNGLSMAPMASVPESGWWWSEAESGRGFFMEWQGNTLDIAGYMYDDAGNPVWYLTVGNQSADGRSFTGNWWSYGNGMTLAGPWRPHTRLSDNVAPLTIRFTGPDTAIMTLPNNRTTSLTRHRF